jgi:hypothetical protein
MKHGMNTGHFYFGKNRTFLNWLDMQARGFAIHALLCYGLILNLRWSYGMTLQSPIPYIHVDHGGLP